VVIAVKMLELVVQRLGQINPAAGEKLGAALNQLKSTIEEVKKEVGSGSQPAGQPAGAVANAAAVPGPKQPMPA
jgi:hypothetical protein